MPSSEIQGRTTPQEVLKLLEAGNARFAAGETLDRDPRRQVKATAAGQNPLAVVLACMDSRVATEIVFDVGLGDIFSIRVAGNIASPQALGSMEFGCAVAGAKLLLVLGHTRCGAVTATVDLLADDTTSDAFAHLENLPAITEPIAESVRAERETTRERNGRNEDFVDRVAMINVERTLEKIREQSETLRDLESEGKLLMVGGLYDVKTGRVAFLDRD